MPTRISAVSGNSDAWETSHSESIDLGSAAAGRRIIGFCGRYSDATERITAASQITLDGSSTGVTLAATSTNPVGQAGSFYARRFEIDVPSGLAGTKTLTVNAGDATARRIFIVAECLSDAGTPTGAYGSNSFNNNPTATIASATGEEVVLMIMSLGAGNTLTPGTGSSAVTGSTGGTNTSLDALREDGGASVTIDGTYGSSQEYCCAVFSVPPGSGDPTVTSADDSAPSEGQAVTIAVTNAGASQGSSTLAWGGVTQTCTAWSATSITFTADPPATLKNGVAADLVLTVDSVDSSAFPLTLSPPAGYSFVNVTSIASTGVLEADPDLEAGWQVEFQDPAVVYADGTWSTPVLLRSFKYRIHDGTAFGALGTKTIAPSYIPGAERISSGGKWVARKPARRSGSWVACRYTPQ